MTTNEISAIVRAFVAGSLGCRCPESVFEQIDYDANPAILGADVPLQRLLVGNRLLVYILECDDPAALRTLLPPLVEKGKAEKDRCGYNRLRVVVSTRRLDAIQQEAEQLFSGVAGQGDNVHLHMLSGCRAFGRMRDLMAGYNRHHV